MSRKKYPKVKQTSAKPLELNLFRRNDLRRKRRLTDIKYSRDLGSKADNDL